MILDRTSYPHATAVHRMRRPGANLFVVLVGLLLMIGCIRETATHAEPAASAPQLRDMAGTPLDTTAAVHVLLFVRADCPISNRYAPVVRELVQEFTQSNVQFTLVYPNPKITNQEMEQHRGEFDYPCQTWHDPNHKLVKLAGATITPEAAVFDARKVLTYCGRIDDRITGFGTQRAKPTKHDLNVAIQKALRGEGGSCVRTEAVGCYIGDLNVAN